MGVTVIKDGLSTATDDMIVTKNAVINAMDGVIVSKDMGAVAKACKRRLTGRGQSFIPGTILCMADGSFKNAADLEVGDSLRSIDGGDTQVLFKNLVGSQLRSVVEITTRRGCHKFTAEHHLAVACNSGTLHQAREAKDLAKGMTILIGQSPTDITNVKRYDIHTSCVELHFNPDVPVESYMISKHGGIFSFGGKFPETPRDGF